MTGEGVHQAGRALVLEGVIQAGLVAGDAGVDGLGAIRRRLVDELRVREERPGHADHVGAAVRQHLLGLAIQDYLLFFCVLLRIVSAPKSFLLLYWLVHTWGSLPYFVQIFFHTVDALHLFFYEKCLPIPL